MEVNLSNLKNDYTNGDIVPFIGAGLSVPFNVPTWRELIEEITEKYTTCENDFVKKGVEVLLDRNDYWGAIDQLKNFFSLVDQDIQSEVVSIINEKKKKLDDDALHNYSDIGSMNFSLYLTTNYEHLLNDYIKSDNVPILIQDIQFNIQDLYKMKRILHLHGYLSNPGSIVISKQSYIEHYKGEKYKDLLKVVTSAKKLLFMGFSFDDQFLCSLIKDHRDIFSSNHYILLDSPSDEKVKKLKEEYGLITIKYDSRKSSHSEEIRKVLATISEKPNEENFTKKTEVEIPGDNSKQAIIGAKISDMDQDMGSNLFYRKLEIEDISPPLLELSLAFYVAAEGYIRDLKNNGMSIDVINAVLMKVLIKYRESYYNTFHKHGDSQYFVEIVHETLEKVNFGRISEYFNDNQVSDQDENRGLIHILADDEKKNIWWGEKRL